MKRKLSRTKNSIALLLAVGALIQAAFGQVTITKTGGTDTGMHSSGITLSPDGSKLYVAFWEDEYSSPIQERSLPGLELLQTIAFGGYHTHQDVVISEDGCRIFTQNYYYATASQVNLCAGNARTDLSAWTSWPGDIDITPDKATVVVSLGRDGRDYDMNNDGLAFYNISGGAFSALGFASLPDEPVGHKLGFSADGQYVYVVTRARKSSLPRLYELSLSNRQVTRWMEFDSTILSGVACAGDKVFVGDFTKTNLWSVDRSNWTKAAYTVPASPGTLAMHPDGKHLFVLFVQASSLAAIDITTMGVVGSYASLQPYPFDIEFAPRGDKMYVAHRNPTGGIFAFDVTFASDTDLTKMLRDAVMAIPDFGFDKLPEQRRNALLNKVNAVGQKLGTDAQQGALQALIHDLRPRVEEWLLDDYTKTSPLQLEKAEVLAVIDTVIHQLESQAN